MVTTWQVFKRGFAQVLEPGRPAECINVKGGRPLGGDFALTLTPRTMRASKGEGWGLNRPVEEGRTQGGQGRPRPLGPRSHARPFHMTETDLEILDECTQDGQGGFGPQETQGRTEAYIVSRTAHGVPVECAQNGQGGSGPQETQGCTSFRGSSSTTIGGPKECAQDGQGGHGPQETQGCTIPYCEDEKAHVVLSNDLRLRQGSSGLREAQCGIATDA